MNAEKPLHILQLEDSPQDAEIIRQRLLDAGFSMQMDCAANEKDFTAFLRCGGYDLVLADYRLPNFDAPAALLLTKSICPGIPFIAVTGAVGDEKAVELLKLGATDCVLKDRLVKLPRAIKRALAEVREHQARRQAEAALHRLNRELHAISNCKQTLMRADDEQSLISDICRIVCDEAGYRMAWVGYAENDAARTVNPVAWAGVEEGYLAEANITWADTPRGNGPGGIAIRSGGVAYVQDFATDPQTALWRDSALQRGYRSCIALPLKDESAKVFGVLLIYSTEINAFSPDEIRLLDGLAGDLAFGITVLRSRIKRSQAEQSLRQREAELNESQRLAHIGSWDWTVLNDSIWWSDEYYRIYGQDPKQPTPNYANHLNAYPAESAQRLDLVVKRAMETGEPYEVDLELARPTPETRWIVARGEAKRDAGGKIAGLRGTAQNITERKQGELALARANRALRTLSSCNEALVHAATESELLDSICCLIVETGGYRMAWVGFPEQDAARTVRVAAHYGHDDGYLAAAGIEWSDSERGRGPAGTAMRTGAVQINQDLLGNPAMTQWRDAAQQRGYRSSIALPLKSAVSILGVLTIYAAECDMFNNVEVSLLQELAEDLAYGIATRRIQIERDHIAIEQLHDVEILRESLEDSVKAIANTLEMRDPYTGGHQRRVGQLAVAIAQEMGLPEETSHGIGLAASIHDLGKISVPAEILAKPSKLSAIEFMLLKNHAQAGYDILKDIKFPWPIATMVLQHHERQDGSGYPQGLKGEQILLESRILAVADVVEAMASHRPYRAAQGIDAALAEIGQGRATEFDAAVVDACLRLFRDQGYVIPA